MSKHLSKDRKLLVVSDTGMCQIEGEDIAFAPVVKELEEMLLIFNSITWIGFKRDDQKNNSAYIKVKNPRIKIIYLEKVGGKSIIKKISILFSYPIMWKKINSEIKKHSYIHCRAPSNPAYIAMLLSNKYLKKQFWFKYAGNWVGKASFFYNYQRNKLKCLQSNSIVTVNGKWENQPKNILAFENPCLTEKDRILGESYCRQKNNENTIDFCFVGGLNNNKGVDKIIKAFKNIDSIRIGALHIVGDGYLKSQLEKEAKNLFTKIIFYGSLSKEKVQKIYLKSHFIILPSQSEGFPKVIGEAMNYGCVPIVSNISCIGQYIEDKKNGFLLNTITPEGIESKIHESLDLDSKDFKDYITKNYNSAKKFTYGYFLERIKKEIFKT